MSNRIPKMFSMLCAVVMSVGCASSQSTMQNRLESFSAVSAAAMLLEQRGSEQVRADFDKVVKRSAAEQSLPVETFLVREYKRHLDQENSSFFRSINEAYDSAVALKSMGYLSEQSFDALRKDFAMRIKDNAIKGIYTDYASEPFVKTNFPELLTQNSKDEISAQSIAHLSKRATRPLYSFMATLIEYADRKGSNVEITQLKQFLSGYDLSYEQIDLLNKTKYFKADLSRVEKATVLGDFHIKDVGKFDAEVAAALKKSVRNFKDPEAVKFRDVSTIKIKDDRYICGELNGVNSYGAYTGFKTFLISSGVSLVEGENFIPSSNAVGPGCNLRAVPLSTFW